MHGFQKILKNIPDHVVFVDPYAIFKMQIKTSVIQINGSHHSNFIITDKRLGMKESGLVFINFYTGFYQLRIIRLGKKEYHFFIRHSRSHDPHIYSAFCSKAESCHHFIVNDQIRRTDIHITLCPVDNIQINIFSQCLPVKRSICKGLYKSASLKLFRMIGVG